MQLKMGGERTVIRMGDIWKEKYDFAMSVLLVVSRVSARSRKMRTPCCVMPLQPQGLKARRAVAHAHLRVLMPSPAMTNGEERADRP